MLSSPGVIQFGVTQVISESHLRELVRKGAEDFLARECEGHTSKIVLGCGAGGVLALHRRDGSCERIEPPAFRGSVLSQWIAAGRLYCQAVDAPGLVSRSRV